MDIRKKWLISFFSYEAVVFVFYLVGIFLSVPNAWAAMIGCTIGLVLGISMNMHCSYVMKGTKLLWCNAYLAPLWLLFAGIMVLSKLVMGSPIQYLEYVNIVILPFGLVFSWMSYKLRKRYLYESQQVVMTADVSY